MHTYTDQLKKLNDVMTSEIHKGMGNHGACIIDGFGEFPTLPQIPRPIVKDGMLPRITMVSTIDDKAHLTAGWKKIDLMLKEVVAMVEKENDFKMPEFKVEKSNKDGVSTYAYNIPGVHKNCNPSIVITDNMLFATTSPDQVSQLRSGKAGMVNLNNQTKLNITELGEFFANWVALVDEHGAGVFKGDNAREDYKKYRNEVRPGVMKFIELLLAYDSFTVTEFERNGDYVSSMHLKMAK